MMLSVPSTAQAPYLVKDINTTTDLGSSNPNSFVQVGSKVFFIAEFPDGEQLWKTDGTVAGTAAVTNTYFTSLSSLTSSNGKLFFFSGSSQTELWVSDGSAAGTRMLKVISPYSGQFRSIGGPTVPVDMNGSFFFSINDFVEGNSLWKSDGTSAGTVLVKNFGVSFDSPPAWLTAMNGNLFFVTGSDLSGYTLWRSDGTDAGTVAVKVLMAGSPNSSPSNLVNVNGKLYFTAYDGAINGGVALWKSDGTESGTVALKTIMPATLNSSIQEITNVNGEVFFRTILEGVDDTALWKSDGTADGTTLVTDICNGSCVSGMSNLTNFNGTLFFSAYQSLWKSDGTQEGTLKVAADIQPTDLVVLNAKLFFSAFDSLNGRELWTSDGTNAGTVIAADICPGLCSALYPQSRYSYGAIIPGGTANFVSFSYPAPLRGILGANGKLFFAAMDGVHASEPWASDGTAGGSAMLKNIVVNTSSRITSAADLKGNLIFSAFSGSGAQLWKSAGTESGTTEVNGTVDAFGIQPAAKLNGSIFFAGSDSTHGIELWKTDGTDAGTVLVRDINAGGASSFPAYLTVVGNSIFFIANDGVHATEIWKTDGTEAGTVLVKDISPSAASYYPYNLTNLNGTLYFTAADSSDVAALWKSDGTDAGTVVVKSFPPPIGLNCIGSEPILCNSFYAPQSLTAVNNTLFFIERDMNGQELWKSDGTTDGTVAVTDASFLSIPDLTAMNGTLYFTTFGGGLSGSSLWKSDGTVQGTVEIKALSLPLQSTTSGMLTSSNLTNVNGTLFLTAPVDSVPTLWKSDGTTDGTVVVKAVQATALRNVNGTLFFAGADENGTELWKSDGSAAGTTMVADINPGRDSSFPVILGTSHGRVFFSATDDSHGTELWALQIAPTSVTLRSSRTPSVANTSVTLSATVASSITGTPTGTVTFVDGTVPLGTVAIDASGVATFTTSALSTGTHSLSAVYSGDSNYAESTSPTFAQVVLSASPDYTLAANPSTATIHAGNIATFTITATADTYFDGTVSLSCGQLPKGVSCSFTPAATLAPTNGHPASATLTISTTPQTVAAKSAPQGTVLWASLGGAGLFGCLLIGRSTKSRTTLALVLLVALTVIGGTSCGGGGGTSPARINPNGTPSGPATIQVTATATSGTTGGNTSAHSLLLNITVQ